MPFNNRFKNFRTIIYLLIVIIVYFIIFWAYSNVDGKENVSVNTGTIDIVDIKNDKKLDYKPFEFEKEYGIILGGFDGIYVFDFKTNSIIENLRTGKYISEVIKEKNILYLTDREGLKIYDFSNIKEPKLINSFNTYGESLAFDKVEDFVYLADGKNGIVSFKIEEDFNILIEQHVKLNGIVLSILHYDDFIFAMGPKLGLLTFEIKDGKISEYSHYNDFINPTSMQIFEDNIYLLDEYKGLYMFDIKDIINDANTQPVKIYPLEMTSSFYVNKDGIFYANSKGIFDLAGDEIIRENFDRTKIKVNDNLIYISQREKGFKVYDILKKEYVYKYNILNYINNFKVFENGILIEDSSNIMFMDNEMKKIWDINLNGEVLKYSKGFLVSGDTFFSIVDNKKKVTYDSTINVNNFKSINIGDFIINEDGIFRFENFDNLYAGKVNDLCEWSNGFLFNDDNNIYFYDYENYEVTKKFFHTNKIQGVFTFENGIIFYTNYSFYILNNDFDVIDSFQYDIKPDNFIVSENKVFFTIQSRFFVVDIFNTDRYKIKEMELPIVDIDYFENKVYISLSSEGIIWYDINENLDLEKLGEVLIFNANNFLL